MPEIRPFRAWRYNSGLTKNISEITSPLFDVVTPKQLEKLYSNPLSSIHLSVPKGENSAESAGSLLRKWKDEKVIVQDEVPGIYVYFQHFSLPGSVNEITRKGFVVNVKMEEGGILLHENTIPGQLNDRIEILEKTEMNISPTHGFYSDPSFELEAYLDEAIKQPIYETEDYQGVRDILAVIHDREVILKFLKKIRSQQLILGDGHHRYQASLKYMNKQEAVGKSSSRKNSHQYHLMYLTNAESTDIRILATHRVLSGIQDFNENDILSQLGQHFRISKIDDAFAVEEVIRGKKWTFGLLFKDNAYRISLKPAAMDFYFSEQPQIVKDLDISVAHHFVVDPILQAGNLSYDRSFSDCYARILQGEAQLAVIVNEISMQTVKDVCYSGHALPPKSTYFFPKVISGFLFSSINHDEFRFPANLSF